MSLDIERYNPTEKDLLVARLQGSLLLYCQTMYPLLTGREFMQSNPMGRESHMVTICRELMSVFRMETPRLIINVPFGHFKTTMLCLFVTWCFTHYPDCQFIFMSYGSDPATKGTYLIRRIMDLYEYKYLFNVRLRTDSKAKDNFMTLEGGIVRAFSSGGPVTGADAGLPGVNRFSGCLIYDDPHKGYSGAEGDDAPPPSMAEVNLAISYYSSAVSRLRGHLVPLIVSGQRVLDGDLSGYLLSGKDGEKWKHVILRALDENRNPLFPEEFPLYKLETWEKYSPNFFNAQCQQNPNPAGGRLFKSEWFHLLDEDPDDFECTFITVDTAESDKDIADYTVFSFWGFYKLKEFEQDTHQHALHSIHGIQIKVEPYQLKDELLSFYSDCLRYRHPPSFVVIEKKSTGKTLWSVLDQMRGIEVRGIERTKASGSKSTRYNEMQQYIARKLVTFTENKRHTKSYIEHLAKITDNDSHKNDDICDTLYDAIRIAFIEKTLYYPNQKNNKMNDFLNELTNHDRRIDSMMRNTNHGKL